MKPSKPKLSREQKGLIRTEEAKIAKLDEKLADLDIEGLELDRKGLELDREGLALTADLVKAAFAAVKVGAPSETLPREGDASLFGKKDWVTFEEASSYLGRTTRAVEIAATKGKLRREGSGTNRRISVPSLLKYRPPEKNTN